MKNGVLTIPNSVSKLDYLPISALEGITNIFIPASVENISDDFLKTRTGT